MDGRSGSLVKVVGYAVVTALTLDGALVLGLVMGNVLFEGINVHLSDLASSLLVLPLVLLGLFGGGALWGVFVASMNGGEKLRLAKVGGLTYGLAVLLGGIALELVFTGLSALGSGALVVPIHVAFTIVFVPAAGVIAGLCARRVAGALGRDEVKGQIGLYSGVAGALGFLAVNMVMLALGWQVGGPGAAARSTMITVMLTSNAGTALAGGAAMGWALHGAQVGEATAGDVAVGIGV